MSVVFSPDKLHIAVSKKCNIKCRHCHQDANSENTLSLTETDLLPVIETATKLGIKRVVVMGGEIFLFPELIKKLIQIIRDNHLYITLITNGYWGKSIEFAEHAVDLLEEAGWYVSEDLARSDNILVSAGEYHQEWLPTSTVNNAICAYYGRFRDPVYVDFEYTTGNEYLVEQFKENIPSSSYTFSKIRTKFYRFGRLVSLDTPNKLYTEYEACMWVNRLFIQTTGEIYPCCGYNDNNAGLCIGSIYSDNLSTILSTTNELFIINLLTNISLGEVYNVLKQHHPELPTHFSHICELCEIICKFEFRKELENEFGKELAALKDK